MPSPSRRHREYLPPDPTKQLEVHEQRIQCLEQQLLEMSKQDASLTGTHTSRDRGAQTPQQTKENSIKRAPVCDEDELRAIVDRLSKPLERPESDPAMELRNPASARILAAEEVEELVDRLGVRDLSTRGAKREELLQAAECSLPLLVIQQAKGEDALIKLDMEQQQALGERMCNQELEKRKRAVQSMGDALFNASMKACPPLSRGQLRSCAARLCDASLAKKEDEMRKLQEKYMVPLVPPKKLSKEAQAACADRLTKK